MINEKEEWERIEKEVVAGARNDYFANHHPSPQAWGFYVHPEAKGVVYIYIVNDSGKKINTIKVDIDLFFTNLASFATNYEKEYGPLH